MPIAPIPAELKVLVLGSKTSVLDRAGEVALAPPATRTRPSGRGAATAPTRSVPIEPIPAELKVFVPGLKISALEWMGSSSRPPATRTRPSGSGAATAPVRTDPIVPTGLKLFVCGL